MNPGAGSLKDKQNRQALKQAQQEKKRTQINTIRNERGETTTDTTEMQRSKKFL